MSRIMKNRELSDDARALLRAAEGGDALGERDRMRMLESLRRRLGEPTSSARSRAVESGLDSKLLGAAASFGARVFGSRGRVRSKPVVWALAALLVTGSVAAFGGWSGVLRSLQPLLAPALAESARADRSAANPAARSKRSAPSALSPAPSALSPAPSALSPAPSALSADPDAPEPRALPPTEQHSLHRSAPSAARAAARAPHSLGSELDLMMRARDALRRGEFARARELAARHAQAFPHGDLCQERAAIEALADCRETGNAVRGAAFVRRWPDSVLGRRVSADCGLAPNAVPAPRSRATQ
jgi:hypothetical protein